MLVLTGLFLCLFVFGATAPQWARASSFTRILDHTQRRATVGRTPLDEWSVRRTDLYLTTHNTHNRRTSMPPGGIRTHNLSRRAAKDLRLRPRGHWDRLTGLLISRNVNPVLLVKTYIYELLIYRYIGLYLYLFIGSDNFIILFYIFKVSNICILYSWRWLRSLPKHIGFHFNIFKWICW